jgi:hypothetical protein
MDSLKPWQSVKVSCDRCESMATRRVYATGEPETEVDHGGNVALLLGSNPRPDLGATLVCDRHSDEIANEMCDRHGGSCSEPIRYTWWYWLTSGNRPLRWVGDVAVAVHNWRFERAMRRWKAGLNSQREAGDGG